MIERTAQSLWTSKAAIAQRYSKSRFAPEGAMRGNLSESIDSWSAGT